MRRSEINIPENFSGTHPLKILWGLLKHDLHKIVLALFLFTIKHSPTWLIAVITGNIINYASHPERYSTWYFWQNVIAAVLLIVQNVPGHVLYIKYLMSAIRNMEAELRAAIIRKMQQLSIGFHADFRRGKLHSKILRDVELLGNLSLQLFNGVLAAMVTVLITLGITVVKDYRVAVFFFLVIPPGVFLIHLFRRRIEQKNVELRNEFEGMSSRVNDMLSMTAITRAHAAEQYEIDKLSEHMDRVRKRGFQLDILINTFGASAWVIFTLFHVLCLFVCGWMATRGMISVGDVVMYTAFFAVISNSISSIMNVYPQIAQGMESVRSIGEIMDSPQIEMNEGKRRLAADSGHYRVDDGWFRYPGAEEDAIRGRTLEVQPGECVALVGPSGSGKSTVMSLVIGFNHPTRGRLMIDGNDMRELDLRVVRHHLAVVPQESILFTGSIRDNITYGLESVSESLLQEVLEMANVSEFVRDLPQGLNTPVGENGARLSGGQRQRIAVARALIRQPKVIILDEATSALDVASEMLVQQAIDRLTADRTTFIVAHRLSTIRNADRIIVLKSGQVAESGTEQELLNLGGEFAKLKALNV